MHSWFSVGDYALLFYQHNVDSFFHSNCIPVIGLLLGIYFKLAGAFNLYFVYCFNFLLYFLAVLSLLILLRNNIKKCWKTALFCLLVCFHPNIFGLCRTMNSLWYPTCFNIIFFAALKVLLQKNIVAWKYVFIFILGIITFLSHRAQLLYFTGFSFFFILFYRQKCSSNHFFKLLLILLGVGSGCYFLWYFQHGFIDPEIANKDVGNVFLNFDLMTGSSSWETLIILVAALMIRRKTFFRKLTEDDKTCLGMLSLMIFVSAICLFFKLETIFMYFRPIIFFFIFFVVRMFSKVGSLIQTGLLTIQMLTFVCVILQNTPMNIKIDFDHLFNSEILPKSFLDKNFCSYNYIVAYPMVVLSDKSLSLGIDKFRDELRKIIQKKRKVYFFTLQSYFDLGYLKQLNPIALLMEFAAGRPNEIIYEKENLVFEPDGYRYVFFFNNIHEQNFWKGRAAALFDENDIRRYVKEDHIKSVFVYPFFNDRYQVVLCELPDDFYQRFERDLLGRAGLKVK